MRIALVGFDHAQEAKLQQLVRSRNARVQVQSVMQEFMPQDMPHCGSMRAARNASTELLVVLGNMPLDVTTVTVDTVARVRLAVSRVLGEGVSAVRVGGRRPCVSGSPDIVIFSGGK